MRYFTQKTIFGTFAIDDGIFDQIAQFSGSLHYTMYFRLKYSSFDVDVLRGVIFDKYNPDFLISPLSGIFST